MARTLTSFALDESTPAGSAFAERQAEFEKWTRDDIGRELAALRSALRTGRYPAGRPYRHVNGFTKVVAAEYPGGSRLTLHYWPQAAGAEDDVSRPHDHRFPFSSHLLGGTQFFEELVETDTAADELWHRYVYRPYLRGRVASVAGRGAVGLSRVKTVGRSPLAGTYNTDSATVHRAVTGRQSACATLVLRGPRERRMSTVYYSPSESPPRGGLQFGRWLPAPVVLEQVEHAIRMVAGT